MPQVFFDQPSARGLTATNPDLDANTKVTVATNVIRSALQTPTFAGSGNPNEPAGFQSAKAAEPQQLVAGRASWKASLTTMCTAQWAAGQ